MPELPEVETVRSQLENELVGETISSIEVIDNMCFFGENSNAIGGKIESIERWGKWIGIKLHSGAGMDVHLKMTGRLVLNPEYDEAKHTRVVIDFESGRRLYYWDIRRFGYVRVWEKFTDARNEIKAKLGPDPWEMSYEDFSLLLGKTDRVVKDVILDQARIAGVGNIYANDALWQAKLHPLKRGSEISGDESNRLLDSMRLVLEKGLKLGGASDNTYRDLYDGKGGYQEEFLVYGKTGGKCMECGGKLTRIKISGRSSWLCQSCQGTGTDPVRNR